MATITATKPKTPPTQYSIAGGSIDVVCATTGDVHQVTAELSPGLPNPVELTEGPTDTWTGSIDISGESPGEPDFIGTAIGEFGQPLADTTYAIELVA